MTLKSLQVLTSLALVVILVTIIVFEVLATRGPRTMHVRTTLALALLLAGVLYLAVEGRLDGE
jgi:dipeptide/tripeptide permease